MNIDRRLLPILLCACLVPLANGCAGTLIETATDAAIAVAKTPFKVGAALVDVVSDDDD